MQKAKKKHNYIFHFQHKRSVNRNLPFEAFLNSNDIPFVHGHCGKYLAPIKGQTGLGDIAHASESPLNGAAVHAHHALVDVTG